MKRAFWLMSAIALSTVSAHAQSGSITISSASGDRQVNVVVPKQVQTLSDDELDAAINDLMTSSQSTSRFTQTFAASGNNLGGSYSQSNNSGLTASSLNSSAPPATAARLASRAAHNQSVGRCALYVRKALQSAGYSFTPQPSAYQYANGTLASAGFTRISNDNYVPQVGDVAVFNRTSRNPHGHIQIYDGNQWVSDFRQPNFSPYRNHNGYSVWRDTRYLDATSNTGTMLAMNDQ